MINTLPETEPLPSARICAESQIKTLGKEGFAESFLFGSRHRINTWQTGFFAESQTKSSRHRKEHSPKISLSRANWPTLGKEFLCQVQFFSLSANKFLKITFLPPNFFYPQHTLIKNLCSKLAQFQLCLLYLKILLLNRYFFVYVRYELQVHEVIE
jgi:hypothetical protein